MSAVSIVDSSFSSPMLERKGFGTSVTIVMFLLCHMFFTTMYRSVLVSILTAPHKGQLIDSIQDLKKRQDVGILTHNFPDIDTLIDSLFVQNDVSNKITLFNDYIDDAEEVIRLVHQGKVKRIFV